LLRPHIPHPAHRKSEGRFPPERTPSLPCSIITLNLPERPRNLP
jgi:hypothetical protein